MSLPRRYPKVRAPASAPPFPRRHRRAPDGLHHHGQLARRGESFRRHLPAGAIGSWSWWSGAARLARIGVPAEGAVRGRTHHLRHFDGGTEFYTDRHDTANTCRRGDGGARADDSCPECSRSSRGLLFGCNTLKTEARRPSPKTSCAACCARATRRRCRASGGLLGDQHTGATGTGSGDLKDVPVVYGSRRSRRWGQRGPLLTATSSRPPFRRSAAPGQQQAAGRVLQHRIDGHHGLSEAESKATLRRDACQFGTTLRRRRVASCPGAEAGHGRGAMLLGHLERFAFHRAGPAHRGDHGHRLRNGRGRPRHARPLLESARRRPTQRRCAPG